MRFVYMRFVWAFKCKMMSGQIKIEKFKSGPIIAGDI